VSVKVGVEGLIGQVGVGVGEAGVEGVVDEPERERGEGEHLVRIVEVQGEVHGDIMGALFTIVNPLR
jgi:hypothetical protein